MGELGKYLIKNFLKGAMISSGAWIAKSTLNRMTKKKVEKKDIKEPINEYEQTIEMLTITVNGLTNTKNNLLKENEELRKELKELEA